MSIQAVLFDADGVVILPNRFAHYLEREHGLTREATAGFFRGVFEECLVGHADLRAVLPPFLANWGLPYTLDTFLQRWFDEENAPNLPVVAAIRDLRRRGLRYALATNQEHCRAAYMRERMGFGELFDGFYYSAALGVKKPDPQFFQAVARELTLPGEAILFWDDDAANVAAARACGWRAERYVGWEDFRRRMAGYLPGVGGTRLPAYWGR